MILVLLVTGFALASNAQEEKKKTVIELPQWVKNIKLSGYGMLQYQVQNPDDKTENSFNLRLMRLILDGKIGDFAWRADLAIPPSCLSTSLPNGRNMSSSV